MWGERPHAKAVHECYAAHVKKLQGFPVQSCSNSPVDSATEAETMRIRLHPYA
jgi:hypothetical protein